MPRTATIIAAAVAGLAVLGAAWYGQRAAARVAYKAFLLGRAAEQERHTRAADNPAGV